MAFAICGLPPARRTGFAPARVATGFLAPFVDFLEVRPAIAFIPNQRFAGWGPYCASGCGRNWNFTRIGFEIERYSPFSTANPSSACHTVSEPVDE